MAEILPVIRCTNVECGKVLGRGYVYDGEVEIKCGRCKTMNVIKKPKGTFTERKAATLVKK